MVKNTCPAKRRPTDNKCIEQNTYIKKNKQGFDCCYKIRNKKNDYSLDKVKTFSYTSTKENSKRVPTKAEKPEKKVKETAKKAEKPEKKVKETAKKTEKPEKKVKEPKVKAEKPVKKVKETAKKTEKPEKKVKEPKVKAEKPEKKVKAEKPEKKVKEPKVKAEKPVKKVKETEKKVKEPKVKAENPAKKSSSSKEAKKKTSPIIVPVKKSSSPKEAKKKTTPIMEHAKKSTSDKEPEKIHYYFQYDINSLLINLNNQIDSLIESMKDPDYKYSVKRAFHINAFDTKSSSVDNLINILKTKFKSLKIVRKEDTLAVLQYGKIYIGFHTNTVEDRPIQIVFGCDMTEEGMNSWFKKEGKFPKSEYDIYNNPFYNSEGVYDDDQDEMDAPASPYNPKKKLSKEFLNDFDMMLEQLKQNVDECIRDGVQSEYYDHEVFESNTADPNTANINNLINLLKTKFSPLKIVETSKRLAIVRYKKIYIGMHTNKQVSGVIDILFGCDATEEGISEWFSQEGSF